MTPVELVKAGARSVDELLVGDVGRRALLRVRQAGAMRWERLFDDLEAQLGAAGAAELAAEVAERVRIERTQVELADRLVAWVGGSLTLHLSGGQRVAGTLRAAAQTWLLVDTGPTLVPLRAVLGVTGLGAAAATADRERLARRWSLGAVLRAVARDRSPVRVGLVDGSALTGTVDAVGADHLDLAEHPADELRRPRAVSAVRTVPWAAIASLRPAAGTSSLSG